jgi:hypothetical protein
MTRLGNATLGMTLAFIAAACAGTAPGGTGTGTGSGSATSSGGGSAMVTATGVGGMGGATQSASNSSATAGVGGNGGSGGAGFVCDPAAAPGSIYEATVDMFGSAGLTTMCPYRGQVMLIVNTAAI